MRKSITTRLLAALSIVILFISTSFAVEAQDIEYKVKALYIIRLAAFITWPENPENETFKICIESSDPVSIQLKQSSISVVKGRKLEIIDLTSDLSISQCNFLYLSQGKINSAITKTPIVTVSSQAGFAKQGGMIEFYIENTKVRMKANLQSANDAGIKLSSKLIRLLKIVKPLENDDV